MSAPRIDRLERNLLINGGMDFFERVVPAATANLTTSPVYAAPDRFLVRYTGTVTGTPTVQQVANTAGNLLTTKAMQFALRRNGTVATLEAQQRVESVHCRDLAYLGSGSFSVRVFVPIAGVQVRLTVSTADVIDDFSAVTQVHQSTSAVITASTWTTVDFDAFSLGSSALNGVSVIIELLLPTGTDGAPLNYLLTQAMLVSGDRAHAFSMMGRSVTEEQSACRRYLKRIDGHVGSGTAHGSSVNVGVPVEVLMQSTPTLTVVGSLYTNDGLTQQAATGPAIVTALSSQSAIRLTTTNAMNAGSGATAFTTPTDGSNYVLFEAEL